MVAWLEALMGLFGIQLMLNSARVRNVENNAQMLLHSRRIDPGKFPEIDL